MSLGIEVAGRSDVGRVRPSNEDHFGCDERLGVFVVCDGMGGHAAGEIASEIAVETVLAFFRERKPEVEDNAYLNDAPLGARLLAEAVKQANDAILAYAQEHENTSGMGTTLVAVRFDDGVFSIANVGDSRIYLFREGQLLQLTEDHSLVMEQVRRGMITLEQAKHSSAQNIITRALGTDESTLPDLGEFPAQGGDIVLLTTDGILRHVDDEEISNILLELPSLQAACDSLIDAANAGGGEDNSTCVLLRVRNGVAAVTAPDGADGSAAN
ncbi:MAG: Stp1/IreP family PP2C-type Ser/Thr phosphatase [Candidatus Korobacteraceae bacterium]|jgi:PPM family protein phosphatase